MDDYARARRAMVDSQLRPNGVTDPRLLEAMGRLPRERFVPAGRRPLAYVDEDLPLTLAADARCLMAPMVFARLVQLAEIAADDIVLDIACGTGYSTAVLAQLAGSVVAIDDQAELVELATENLSELEIGNAAAITSALAAGLPDEAPFDAIVINGAVELVPEALLGQLRHGGRLVAVLRRGAVASATVFVKSGAEVASRADFDAATPALAAFARRPEFHF
jgi:protein-L-isoaspartate(D-aspartate) O-methyltransferase